MQQIKKDITHKDKVKLIGNYWTFSMNQLKTKQMYVCQFVSQLFFQNA